MRQSDLELMENGEQRGITRQVHIDGAPASCPHEALSFFPTFFARLLHLLDYIAILRPLLLIPGWTMLLLGYYKGLRGALVAQGSLPLIGNMPIVLRPDNEILITFLLYSLLMGAGYILNQISDSQTDEINDKLHLVAQG